MNRLKDSKKFKPANLKKNEKSRKYGGSWSVCKFKNLTNTIDNRKGVEILCENLQISWEWKKFWRVLENWESRKM